MGERTYAYVDARGIDLRRLKDRIATRYRFLGVETRQALCHLTHLSAADAAAIQRDHARKLAHRARAKDFVGSIGVGKTYAAHAMRDTVGRAEVQYGLPGDALRARVGVGGDDLAADHEKNVRAVALGDETLLVEHQRSVGHGSVGLDFGEDGLEEVGGVNLGVQTVGRETPDRARDQAEARLVVDRRLELREHDERRPGLVEPGVHPARDLLAAREGQPDMDAIAHGIGLKRPANLSRDILVTGNFFEGDGPGRASEPIEVLGEAKNLAIVKTEPFPDSVASLNHGVKRRNNGFIPVNDLAINVDEEVSISFVELLEHVSE